MRVKKCTMHRDTLNEIGATYRRVSGICPCMCCSWRRKGFQTYSAGKETVEPASSVLEIDVSLLFAVHSNRLFQQRQRICLTNEGQSSPLSKVCVAGHTLIPVYYLSPPADGRAMPPVFWRLSRSSSCLSCTPGSLDDSTTLRTTERKPRTRTILYSRPFSFR